MKSKNEKKSFRSSSNEFGRIINYKISYLAEECGFSSHSSFATVFKSIVGMSPVTLIKLIKEERKNGKPEVVN